MTEHFEAHGDNWAVFDYLEVSKKLEKVLYKAIDEGNIMTSLVSVTPNITPINYPTQSPLSVCVLLEPNPTGGFLLVSLYPLMEGISNNLSIKETYTWKNGAEGDVVGEFSDTFNIPFFAPFYFKQFFNIDNETETNVFLAGLAYSITNDNGRSFEVDKGSFYDMKLKEFLDNNQHKTQKDFPNPVIRMDGASMFFPTKNFAICEYRGPILKIEYTDFFDMQVAKIKIRIATDVSQEGDNLIINLYAPKTLLKDYKPQVGDDITGTMWMTGYLGY